MISKNRKIKEVKVLEIKEKLEKAQGIIFAKYQGLTVEEDTELRKKLREAGVEYKVYKNSLTVIAAKELGLDEIESHLVGPLSVALDYEDPTAPARILNEFAKTHKKLELRAGIIQGEIFDAAKVTQLASIPPRECTYCKITWKLQSSIIKFCILVK